MCAKGKEEKKTHTKNLHPEGDNTQGGGGYLEVKGGVAGVCRERA